MMKKNFICLDVGGTFIKYGILAEDEVFLKKEKVRTKANEGGAAVFQQVTELIEKCMQESKCDGICISTAGIVDPDMGTILHASDAIPGYKGINYKQLETKFLLPCEIENDVKCAGLAESISGAGKDSKINLCLTIGTGIGGCLVIDKKVFHGFCNSACEIGYLHMPQGEFQKAAAASALCEAVTKRKMQSGQSDSKWEGIQIFEAAKDGDVICCEELEKQIDILAMGIANLCYAINPEMVILGGGIMAQEAYIKPRIKQDLKKYLIPHIYDHTTICMAEHENDAGMLGAFYHFREYQMKRRER